MTTRPGFPVPVHIETKSMYVNYHAHLYEDVLFLVNAQKAVSLIRSAAEHCCYAYGAQPGDRKRERKTEKGGSFGCHDMPLSLVHAV